MRFLKTNTAVIVTVGPLFDMRPSASVNYAAHVSPIQPKGVRNRLMRFPIISQCANHANHVIGNFCVVVALAFFAAMIGHIVHISAASIPSQVIQIVIAGIAILVAAFVFFAWARANKRLQNEGMNITRTSPAKRDNEPTVMIARRGAASGFKLFPFIPKSPLTVFARPNSSVIANAIT